MAAKQTKAKNPALSLSVTGVLEESVPGDGGAGDGFAEEGTL